MCFKPKRTIPDKFVSSRCVKEKEVYTPEGRLTYIRVNVQRVMCGFRHHEESCMCLAISHHSRRIMVTQTCSLAAPPFRSDPPNQWRPLNGVRGGYWVVLTCVKAASIMIGRGRTPTFPLSAFQHSSTVTQPHLSPGTVRLPAAGRNFCEANLHVVTCCRRRTSMVRRSLTLSLTAVRDPNSAT
jgi:hypothetical protein